MNVEINSLVNLFLVSETIKSICPYNCNVKNLKNRNESEILMQYVTNNIQWISHFNIMYEKYKSKNFLKIAKILVNLCQR